MTTNFGPPRRGVPPPNAGQTYRPTLLSASDVQALVRVCGGGPRGFRNRALITTLYRTGIYPIEASGLTTADVDLAPGTEAIAIYGSKLEDRTLALDETAVPYMREWLEVRQRLPGVHVFCVAEHDTKGNYWKPGGLRRTLELLAQRAGLEDKRVHPLAFRFSLAAELMVEQWPIPYIMTQLGISTVYSFREVLRHLEIEPPPDSEVMEIIRQRPPLALDTEP